MKLSLRNKFLLPTVALVVLALGVATVVSYLSASGAIQKSSEQQMERMTTWTANLVSTWIEDRKLDMTSWSEEDVYAEALQDSPDAPVLRKNVSSRFERLVRTYRYYESLNLVSTTGEIVASNLTKIIGKVNVADRGYFKEAVRNNTLVVSDVIKSRTTGNPIFTMAVPIRRNGVTTGIFLGVIDLGDFCAKFIDTQKIGETGYAFMINAEGVIMAHPVKDKILKENLSKYDFGREMLNRKNGYIVYAYDGVEKIVAFHSVAGNDWLVAITAPMDELLTDARELGFLNLVIALIAVLGAGIIIFFIAQSVAKPIKGIIMGLDRGADQVTMAAMQVADSSQSLAQGSGEQASSLEESSASLEEMASMTRHNAENAIQADSLMKEANQVVDEANQAMAGLTTSMDDINKASEETSKIIKTIDEIAFQTNLLALNAAVEAARAGEAGAGFAVVADEVRNLAMRAAEAARNTADLIETTVKKVHDGSGIVARTAEAFGKVAVSSTKVGELVGEIAAASQEQSQGIEQINRAVTAMDKVTQQNAASAEESASASEEMRGQALSMKEYVEDLVGLVEGRSRGDEGARTAVPAARPAPVRPAPRQAPRTAARPRLEAPKKAADQEIPFDDDDFGEF